MTIQEFGLAGRQAVVIGGGRGIGRGIALALAEAGADVAVAARTPANTDAVATEVRELGVRGTGHAVDATDGADMDRLAAEVLAALPTLDIVVNCVGDSIRGPLVRLPGTDTPGMSSADWQRIVGLNLTSIFEGCRAFGEHLLGAGTGSVINVTGVRAFRPMPNGSAYAASKAAATRLTESLAVEWAPYGVRVNALAPGLFPDPEQEAPADLAAYAERVRPRIPLGRLGNMRDAGLMAVYLASEAASYVTGQSFVIDGGNALL